MNPRVSILVPVCNVEKFLDKCLKSLVEQSLKNIEIICINDGSTDSSLEIIEYYAQQDNRIKVINKANSDYGDSMNQGLTLAKGEYIGIIESDDFIDSDMFKELYRYAQDYQADIVKSSFNFYWENPEKIIYNNSFNISKVSVNFETNKNKLIRSIPAIWAAIYKKEWLFNENIKFLDTPGASYQDTSFHFKTSCLAKSIVLLPDAYLYYRQDNPTSSVKLAGLNKVLLLHKELDEIRKFITQRELNKIDGMLNYYYCMKLEKFMWNYGRMKKEDRGKYFKVLCEDIEKLQNEWNKYLNANAGLIKYCEYLCIKYDSKPILDLLFALRNIKRKLIN